MFDIIDHLLTRHSFYFAPLFQIDKRRATRSVFSVLGSSFQFVESFSIFVDIAVNIGNNDKNSMAEQFVSLPWFRSEDPERRGVGDGISG